MCFDLQLVKFDMICLSDMNTMRVNNFKTLDHENCYNYQMGLFGST